MTDAKQMGKPPPRDSRSVNKRQLVMLGPDPRAQGGMASVIRTYREGGLFDRWSVVFLSTTAEGSSIHKLAIATRTLLKLLGMLIGGQVAAVHIHVAQRRSFVRKALYFGCCVLARRPVIFHIHGSQFDSYYEHSSSPLTRWLIKAVLDRSRFVAVLSDSWQRWVITVTRNRNVTKIPNPIVVAEAMTERTSAQSARTMLFLGRLGQRKGIYDLLDAVKRLTARHPQLVLLCAGDGETVEVKRRAQQLGIASHVRVLGWVSGNEKEQLFAQSSICVLPSYGEGLPVALLEAMAAGLPIVASDVGGIPEAVADGVEGLLIKAGDVAALDAALDRLLADAQLRERMGGAARSKVLKSFAAERVFGQLGEMYQTLGVSPRHP